jgi:CHAT domain-containing protein
MGRFEEATRLHERALEIRQKYFGGRHPDVASSLNNLARIKLDTRKFAEAIELYRRILALRMDALGQAHPHTAQSLNNLGMALLATGTYVEAQPLLEQALAVRRRLYPHGHPDLSETLVNLAVCTFASVGAQTALDMLAEAARDDERMLAQVFSFTSEAQRLEYVQRMRKFFDAFLSLTAGFFSSSQTAVQTTCDLVLRRKATTAEAMAIQNDVVLRGRYPGLAPKLSQLTALRSQIAAKLLSAVEENETEEDRLLAEWRQQADGLESELARGIPEMSLSTRLRVADTAAVAASLSSGTTLIDFVRFHSFDFRAVPAKGESQWRPPRYAAFVLSNETAGAVRLIDLGEAQAIDRLIARFRTAASAEASRPLTASEAPKGEDRQLVASADMPSREEWDIEAGKDLRRAVFDPLTSALAGRKQLILAPDGNLCRVPFEALPADDGSYVIDGYQISYVGAGRDVLRFGGRRAAEGSAPMVIADPDFVLIADAAPAGKQSDGIAASRQSRDALRGTTVFRRLAGTRREGERIGAMLGVQPIMDRKALEAAIKSCRSPGILHLATHGFFLTDQSDLPGGHPGSGVATDASGDRLTRLTRLENPLLRSGLALAGVNAWLRNKPTLTDAEDGLLTAMDVTGLDLLNTDLAVLSACDTGLGQVRVGEGVFGLRRAFVLAGVRTLIASLWKVPDDQTQELMVDFYGHVMNGSPVGEALRLAQQNLKKKYPEAKYWGAFICQGDPGPLSWHATSAGQARSHDG